MRALVALSALLLASARSQPGQVRITVRLLEVQAAKGGILQVGLHQAPGTGFPGPSTFRNLQSPITGPEASLTFLAPAGAYAVAAHHDANSNGRMDSNFIGIPKEGYGISNDARSRFSAPKFAAARVSIARDTTLVVRMVY
jgi:uncharacterized protein (DUF2141 family)